MLNEVGFLLLGDVVLRRSLVIRDFTTVMRQEDGT